MPSSGNCRIPRTNRHRHPSCALPHHITQHNIQRHALRHTLQHELRSYVRLTQHANNNDEKSYNLVELSLVRHFQQQHRKACETAFFGLSTRDLGDFLSLVTVLFLGIYHLFFASCTIWNS